MCVCVRVCVCACVCVCVILLLHLSSFSARIYCFVECFIVKYIECFLQTTSQKAKFYTEMIIRMYFVLCRNCGVISFAELVFLLPSAGPVISTWRSPTTSCLIALSAFVSAETTLGDSPGLSSKAERPSTRWGPLYTLI